LRVWDVRQQKQIASFDLQDLAIGKLLFSADGDHLIASSSELGGVIKVWDVTGRTEAVTRPIDPFFPTIEVAASPDGGLVAARPHKGSVKLWALRPTRSSPSLGPVDRVCGLSFSGDSQKLAVIDERGFLRIWQSLRHEPFFLDFASAGEILHHP